MQTDDWPEASTSWALITHALWKRLCVEGEALDSLQEELFWGGK